MATVTIGDIPVIDELTTETARTIVGGMINLRDDSGEAPLPGEPSGGTGYTGILIHYTLTVIE